MAGRSILFLLGFSLVLVACSPLQTQLPAALSASPNQAATPSLSPATLPLTASTITRRQVTATPGPVPAYAPQPGDEALARAGVYLDSTVLLAQGSSPVRYILSLKGNLPTPCHMLRVKVNPPDATNQIMIEAYSLADPTRMCAEVLKPFEQDIDLGVIPAGHYTVFVNGKQVGELDA